MPDQSKIFFELSEIHYILLHLIAGVLLNNIVNQMYLGIDRRFASYIELLQ